ncbi:MAG: hypothetical protein WBW01_05165 [Terriglobales bacterium]
MITGLALGKSAPSAVQALGSMEFGKGSQVNVPIAILIWLMIIPMMMKVDFSSILSIHQRPRGLLVTLFVNWLVKPFSMALIGWVFFRFEVFSAGTHPAGLNPNAVTAMAEIGINIAGSRSKSVDEFAEQRFDYVFTVCDNAKESCPIFPGGGKRVHESFRDPATAPADQQPEVFRKIRDQIADRLRAFVRSEAS